MQAARGLLARFVLAILLILFQRRHRIKTRLTTRATTANALHRQPSTTQRAMTLNRDDGVTRAGRVKTAMICSERADHELITANQ